MIEEQETITPHPDYLKGFNEGYLIARHMPETAGKLAQAVEASSSERSQGFKDGQAQLVKEQEKPRYPSWLSDNRDTKESNDPAKDLDKDRDMEVEPEP